MIDQWFVCVMFAFKPCAKKISPSSHSIVSIVIAPKREAVAVIALHIMCIWMPWPVLLRPAWGRRSPLRNRKHVHHSNTMNIFALHVSKERLAATDTFSESEPSLVPCCIPSIAEYFFALVFFLCCHGLGYHRFLAMYWT